MYPVPANRQELFTLHTCRNSLVTHYRVTWLGLVRFDARLTTYRYLPPKLALYSIEPVLEFDDT